MKTKIDFNVGKHVYTYDPVIYIRVPAKAEIDIPEYTGLHHKGFSRAILFSRAAIEPDRTLDSSRMDNLPH